MAELLVSAVLPVLLKKLASRELLNFATEEGVRSKLKKWEKTLRTIKALVNDAEQKQQEDEAVKMWLDELRDLAYDAEGILDEYATEALRRKLKIEEHKASTSRARKLIPACCIGFTPSGLRSDISMRLKLDDVTRRLEELRQETDVLRLKEIAGPGSTASLQRLTTSSLPTGFAIYGRDEDKEKTTKTIPMAELVLSAILPVLFEKLTSPELLNFATEMGVRSKFKKWEKTLKIIKALLNDAEKKQQEDEAVEMWLDDLRDLAYDAEDILDEYATEPLRRKLKIEEHEASTSRARKLIPACCIGFTPSDLRSDISMRLKIDDVTRRLEELHQETDVLRLERIAGLGSTASSQRLTTSSLPTGFAIYGRDEDKEKILQMVLRDEPGDANFDVIPIVGMGGIGKTTLTQQVYNDKEVEDFNPKAWVCVSDDFDVYNITRAILESITSSSCAEKHFDAVQNLLKDALNGKKFLIVLDDVWSRSHEAWESLKAPFMAGAPGSKVIVTTRSTEVASIMQPRENYDIKLLSDEDCWSMFVNRALNSRGTSANWNLDMIREKVVQKCKGLPLAAKTLGGLLYYKESEEEWMDILNRKIWDLEGSILLALKLSYYHLPLHLKRCFAYCAILPQDYEFEKNELVFLWMAEGLIHQSSGNKQLEDLGGEYFHDLLSRSLFQISSDNSSKFIMHAFVNELAQLVSGRLHFRLEGELESNIHSKPYEKSRYSSSFFHEYNVETILEVLKDAKYLRTHLSVHLVDNSKNSDSIVVELLLKLKYLRALSLQGYKIIELPNSVEGLRLLKYLNLSYSEIKSLPESINSLYNLQTLLLRHCSNLLKLPSNMEYLINLRHLDILGASSIREMPLGIRKWQCLQTLSNFIVGKDLGSRLRDLKHLNFLGGQLHISRLENVTDFEDTLELILSDKKDLEVLILEWESEFDDSRNEEVEKKVLDMLQPHRNLKELTLTCYGGTKFSSWVGFQSFSKMTVLKLEDCKRCTTLPSLGLLGTLKNLTIKGLRRIKSIGSEIYGEGCSNPFRSLETLCIEDLEEWEHWDPFIGIEGVESFPKLQELSIAQCPKLIERLPVSLSVLEKLVIRNCSELVVALSTFSVPSELEIDECKAIVYNSPTGPKPLNSTTISNISDVGNWLKHDFQRAGVLIVQGSDELIRLWQNEIVFEKPPQGLSGFITFPELDIVNGKPLTILLEGINQNNANLEELQICGCASLMFIFRGQLPPSIKILRIINCEKLQCLLEDKEATISSSSGTSHLEELYIYKCPSLRWLSSRDQLSATLTRLHISHCSKLTTLLSRGRLPTTLKELKIHTCSDLKAVLSKGELPEMLETLDIADCPMLKSIVERFHNNMSLRNIYIQDCPNLVSFPKTGFSKSNLVVWINQGQNLKALASQMPLASLQLLVLCQCPKMSFPTEGLPTNLTSLEIEGPNLYDSLAKWGFHNLTSLRKLSINGCPDALSFPEDEMRMKLPHTLTHLRLENFSNQKYMSSMGFRNLSSLEELRISDCPNLTSLPRLSSSILRLDILNCALLKEACKRDVGKEWPKIALIPYVVIDYEFINYPVEGASAN